MLLLKRKSGKVWHAQGYRKNYSHCGVRIGPRIECEELSVTLKASVPGYPKTVCGRCFQ